MMRVVIAAGGTGGHIYPGIAVADEIVRRDRHSRVLFIGTRKGLETRLVPKAGYNLEVIRSSGLKSVGLLEQAKSLSLIPRAMQSAQKIIREFRADAVIGVGGYVTGPVLLTAWMMRLPTLVMESNALPGFTNRMLARICTAAAVSFTEAALFFGSKAVVTGNPVRQEFFSISPNANRDNQFRVLIFGGSQGAQAINEKMIEALPQLEELKQSGKFQVTHQTGTTDFERVTAAYKQANWNGAARVQAYIDDMVKEFAGADLIIARAGATTSAELVAAGRAAIMIPLPTAADDHQRKNAEALQQAGAARMILQTELSAEKLATEIKRLANEPDLIREMERRSRLLAKPEAAAATVELLEKIINDKNR